MRQLVEELFDPTTTLDFQPTTEEDVVRAMELDHKFHGLAGPQTTAGSSEVPDHFGARFSQPASVTTTVSSWRIPSSPGT
jgi:hypothetical protein